MERTPGGGGVGVTGTRNLDPQYIYPINTIRVNSPREQRGSREGEVRGEHTGRWGLEPTVQGMVTVTAPSPCTPLTPIVLISIVFVNSDQI